MSYEDDYHEEEINLSNDEIAEFLELAEEAKESKITITIDAGEYLSGSLNDIIVARLSERLRQTIEKQIKDAVEVKIFEHVNDKFDAIAKEHVEHFFTKSYQKTNEYGQKVGGEVAIQEMLSKEFSNYMNQKVDSNFRPDNYSSGLPRSQQMINQLAHKPLQAALDAEVKRIGEMAKNQMQALIASYIAEKLTPHINVPPLPQIK